MPDLTGLRDRALVGVMTYTFARVNAVLQMKVRDYFVQGCRGWVRLHEKGAKERQVPCHHTIAVSRRIHCGCRPRVCDIKVEAKGIHQETAGIRA
jgi:site-specific recombinase XerD